MTIRKFIWALGTTVLLAAGLVLTFGPPASATYEDPPPSDVPCDQPTYTVVDQDAYDETIPGQWWNWSPNQDQGPFEGPPDFPSDARGTWQGPHTEGGPAGVGTYQTGSPGNANWFHRDEETVIHHDAVTHEEPNPDYPCSTTVPTTEPPTTVPCVEPDGRETYDEDPPPECPPTPVAFAFSDPTPPTCDQVGSFLQQEFPGVSITVDPPFDGPGTYTVTATLDDPDAVWADIGGNEPRSRVITVEDALGFQSEDPNAPCFLEPPPTTVVPPPTTVVPPPTTVVPPPPHTVPTCADDASQAGCARESLPRTGSNVGVMIAGGLALIAGGFSFLKGRKRFMA